ncbi:MAG: ABC transporter substrate-binding protein [Patescibacteria group bacterium]|nr:ABC transporter substrate-binding protein [Patescibacteria group bacterium]
MAYFLNTIKNFWHKWHNPEYQRLRQQNDLDLKLVTQLSKKRMPSLKQLKYLPSFLHNYEKNILRLLLIIILICVVFLAIRAYLVHTQITPLPGGEYREGLIGNPQYINPVLAPLNSVDQDLSTLIYSGLLKYDQNSTQPYKLVNDLAREYTIDEPNKTITFKIRDNVYWHDGQRLTANDVIFTFELLKTKEYQSPYLSQFKDIQIEKIDDFSLKIVLPEIFSPFLNYLTVGILPQHIWQTIPLNQFTLAQYNLKPIGSGPFQFENLVKDKFGFIKTYTLKKNNNYYDQPAYFDKLNFKFYYSNEDALSALESKQIDGFLVRQIYQDLIDKKWINHQSLYLPQYTAIFFNNQKITNKTLRQALAYAINKEEILTQLNSPAYLINSPLTFNLINIENAPEKYDFNPEIAKQLLEADGWQLQDGVYQQDDKKLRVALSVADTPIDQKIAQIVQREWQALGIETAIQTYPVSQLKEEIINQRDYQILLFSIVTNLDPDPYPVWHSSQAGSGINLSVFKNDQVDKILEKARHVFDTTIRNQDYQQFQELLIEQTPAIFLYNQSYTYLINQRILGITEIKAPDFSTRFNIINRWFIEGKKQF